MQRLLLQRALAHGSLGVGESYMDGWWDTDALDVCVDKVMRADLKRKMSQSEAINATEQRIREIAYNIALHYQETCKNDGWKGQVACASKRTALKYWRYLRENGIDAEISLFHGARLRLLLVWQLLDT